MPELPEVEVTRRRIAALLVGRRIVSVRTSPQSYFFLTPPRNLVRGLVDREVQALDRHGKYLLARLDDGKRLMIHLGMSGQLFAKSATSPRLLPAARRASRDPHRERAFRPDRHTHLELGFADPGPAVLLRDVRKFGKVRLLGAAEREPRLERLGPDALEAGAEHLYRASRGRKVAIKSLLLDQSVLAGVGNIYADESLFRAGIRPTRAAGRLARRECAALVRALRQVLERSIETGGSSIQDFIAPDGADGHYQDERLVYARHGMPCSRCGRTIRRTRLAQRSTHYCPGCQR